MRASRVIEQPTTRQNQKNRLRGARNLSRQTTVLAPRMFWRGFRSERMPSLGKRGGLGSSSYGKMPGPEVCIATSVWSQLPVFVPLDVHPGAAGSVELLTYWSSL